MVTLGVNFLGAGHDSSVALAVDGRVVYAIAEERLTRVKQDSSFPIKAIHAALKYGNYTLNDIDQITFSWPPLSEYHKANMRMIMKRDLNSSLKAEMLYYYRSLTTRKIQNIFASNKISFNNIVHINHHMAHALSVFPYMKEEKSLIFIIDGRGIKEATSVYLKDGDKLDLLERVNFPNSLGLFYSEMTGFCGFKKHFDEWKVMGLAPYGKKIYDLSNFISTNKNSYSVNHKELLNAETLTLEGKSVPKRTSDKNSINDDIAKDVALSTQHYFEEALKSFVGYYVEKYNVKSVGMAGGVGLNCKANGYLLRELKLTEIFIQPAATDDGTAIGAALYPFFQNKTIKHEEFYPYLGDEYSNEEIEKVLKKYKLKYEFKENVEADAAMELSKGNILGWFQGRDEFGPRALGNRSILSDPRDPNMKDKVNDIVKYRENWRPFAPSMLAEKAGEVLKHISWSPYMILTDYVSDAYEKKIPAVVHVDKTLRPQTVDKKMNPRYWNLISEFEKITGVPVVVNTSFNLKGEPNVSSPTDAVRTFFTSGLNLLYVGNYKVYKQ